MGIPEREKEIKTNFITNLTINKIYKGKITVVSSLNMIIYVVGSWAKGRLDIVIKIQVMY